MSAVVYWSAWLYAPFVVLILWPWLLSLSATFADTRRFVVYPLAGATAGLIPVVVFGAFWHARTVLSPEALLFAILFSTAGALFGIGYALVWNWVHR